MKVQGVGNVGREVGEETKLGAAVGGGPCWNAGTFVFWGVKKTASSTAETERITNSRKNHRNREWNCSSGVGGGS